MSILIILYILLGCSAAATDNTTSRPTKPLASNFIASAPLTGNPVDTYTVPVQVGKLNFDALLDSGSSNLILPGADCIGCGPVTTIYKPSASSKDLHIFDNIQYADSTGAYGKFYLDDVAVSNAGLVSLAVMSVTVCGLQGANSKIKVGAPMQGILGIGPESGGLLYSRGIGRLVNESYLDALTEIHTLGVIAVQLCNYNGNIWFGGYDPTYVKTGTTPEYVPMSNGSNYDVYMGSMFLGDHNFSGVANKTRIVVMDTATSAFVLPVDLYFKFMTIIDPKTDIFNDTTGCMLDSPSSSADIDKRFPNITLGFITNLTDLTVGNKFEIQASQSYMVPQLQKDGNTSWCNVISLGVSGRTIMFGAPMMRHFVVIFDTYNNQIGFVPQLPEKCPTRPSRPSSAPAPSPSQPLSI